MHDEQDLDEQDLPAPLHDTARIHLRVLGEDRTFTVPVPLGPRTLLEILPAARELTEQVAAVAVSRECQLGRVVTCAAGCSACCRHLVAVSPAEAQDLADFVVSLPPTQQTAVRARFAAATERFEAAGLLDPAAPRGQRALQSPGGASHAARVHTLARRYFQEQVPCPFLENDLCSVYERRPMVCREHFVTSPAENCARLDGVGLQGIESPLDMAPTLARAGGRALGMPVHTLPLLLALEWCELHGAPLRESRDGLELLQILVGEVDTQYAQDFEQRGADGVSFPGQERRTW